jgi:hypothetical protein
MARAKEVVSDMHSQEFDQVRRSLHDLMLVLENVASEVDAGNITADEAFTVLTTTLSNGRDENISGVDGGGNNYTGTQREVVGVKPTPLHPERPKNSGTVSMGSSSDF